MYDIMHRSKRNRGVVQLVERRSPKPHVKGSSPFAPAKKEGYRIRDGLLFSFVCTKKGLEGEAVVN